MGSRPADSEFSENVIDWLNKSLSERDIECDNGSASEYELDQDANDDCMSVQNESESESDVNIVQNLFDSDIEDDSILNSRSEVNASVDTSVNMEIEESVSQANDSVDGNEEWVDIEDTDDGPVSNIPVTIPEPGPVLPNSIDHLSQPIDYFSLFFSDEVLTILCDETNKQGNIRKQNTNTPKSRLKSWQNMTISEAKALLGTVINMGLNPKHDVTDYFTTKWVSHMKFFSDVFPKDRFLLLFWSLHFSSEEGTQRGAKISNFVQIIREKCKLFYNPSHKISIDKSTILFKGRVVFRIYNPNKPTKFGMKVFVLSDSTTGYIYYFIPYFGKQDILSQSQLLKTTQIVTGLCESLVKDPQNPPSGHHLYVDRYYNSPELANELLKKNIVLTGTVMQNRRGMPKIDTKKMKRGDVRAFRKGDIAVLCWKDKRPVMLLSTKHKASKLDMTAVADKNPSKQPTMKPNMIIDYTKHMGGVDRADHYVSNYQFMRRTKRWYRKMFFWLLEVSTVNSYLLYNSVQEKFDKQPMKHREFRMKLVEELVTEHMSQNLTARRRPGRPARESKLKRLDGKLHFMGKAPRGNRCVVCYKKKVRKETVYFCNTCQEKPHLHPEDCFEAYHTKDKYA